MTTKRFTKYIPNSYGYTYTTTIVDHKTNKQTGNIDDFIDMLNALHDENEQLKSSNMEYEDALARHEETIKKLRKHNTQTYLTIKEAYKTERTQIGKNVLKQLLEKIE